MDVLEVKEIGKYRIKIYQDTNAQSPRTSMDNLGKMICFHRRYTLGDKHDYRHEDYESWYHMRTCIEKIENVCVILPLYLYDHSGLTIKTTPFSCPWDSGQLGWVFVSKEKVREEYSVKRITKKVIEKVTNVLLGEVETYDQYLTGEVYGYEIYEVETCSLGHEHEIFKDSCWGYYGQEYCVKDAEYKVEHYNKEDIEEGRALSVN